MSLATATIPSLLPNANETQPLLVPVGTDETVESDGRNACICKLPSLWEDACDIIRLGIPIFMSRVSFLGMRITDTALLGHVSTRALTASSLSDLWTMWSLVLLDGRSLGVLVGGAVGAGNPKLAGVYLQISYLVVGIIAIFVIVCWNFTETVVAWYLRSESNNDKEEDPSSLAQMAGYYARVSSFGIPAICGVAQVSQFFSAQRILHPDVNAAALGLVANLLFGLFFVLGWPQIPGFDFHGFGFVACPIVTTVVLYVRLFSILIINIGIQQLHVPCWDGWKLSEMTWARIQTYCHLYIPAACSLSSDFWRVTVMGAIAADLGETEVAIFNTSYRIMWIALVLISSLASASGIDMSIRLGRLDSKGARQAGYVGVVMSIFILMVLSTAVYLRSDRFAGIFTDDENFVDKFREARLPFAVSLFLMNLSIAVERIPYCMGRTNEIFWAGFIAGWGVQIPAVFMCTKYWRRDLIGLYSGMAIGFGMQVLAYSGIAMLSDWEKFAEITKNRSEAQTKLEGT